jgi:hypothetical protein
VITLFDGGLITLFDGQKSGKIEPFSLKQKTLKFYTGKNIHLALVLIGPSPC